MKIELPDIRPEELTPLVESLLAIIRQVLDRVQQLEETVQQQRDEIAKLKGQKPRPDMKPSMLEATKAKTEVPEGGKRPGSAKRPKTAELSLHRELPLYAEDLPVGSTFCTASRPLCKKIPAPGVFAFLAGSFDMRRRTSVEKNGFTLIELLVVLAIIGVLVALLLPAVQKAREAAARAACSDHLRQIALATHAYHDAQGVLPVNYLRSPSGPYGSSYPSWSWLARILPYIEQGNLYNQAQIATHTLYQSQDAAATQVAIFLCPSDPNSATGPRADAADLSSYPPTMLAGQTNYKGVGGANWAWGDPNWRNRGANGNWDGLDYGDGIFYRYDWRKPKTLLAITDGTSTTFMVGEDVPSLNHWCAWPYSNTAVGTCAMPPNAQVDAWNWQYSYGFRSRHPGGLQFAYADGFQGRWCALAEAPRHLSLPSQEGLRLACSRAGFGPVVHRPDGLLNCAAMFGLSAVPWAATPIVYGEKRVGNVLLRVLAGLLALCSLPVCLLDNYVARRPAAGLVFARKREGA